MKVSEDFIRKVLITLNDVYYSSYKISEDDISRKTSVWYSQLKDFRVEIVKTACKSFIEESVKMPNCKQMITKCRDIMNYQNDKEKSTFNPFTDIHKYICQVDDLFKKSGYLIDYDEKYICQYPDFSSVQNEINTHGSRAINNLMNSYEFTTKHCGANLCQFHYTLFVERSRKIDRSKSSLRHLIRDLSVYMPTKCNDMAFRIENNIPNSPDLFKNVES